MNPGETTDGLLFVLLLSIEYIDVFPKDVKKLRQRLTFLGVFPAHVH